MWYRRILSLPLDRISYIMFEIPLGVKVGVSTKLSFQNLSFVILSDAIPITPGPSGNINHQKMKD